MTPRQRKALASGFARQGSALTDPWVGKCGATTITKRTLPLRVGNSGLLWAAVQDNEVIAAHAYVVLGGRYNTRFCSAFMVRLPVPGEHVIDVIEIDAPQPLPSVEVSLFRSSSFTITALNLKSFCGPILSCELGAKIALQSASRITNPSQGWGKRGPRHR
jgi:hypothetical protein